MLTTLRAVARRSAALRRLARWWRRRIASAPSPSESAVSALGPPTQTPIAHQTALCFADSAYRIPGLGALIFGWCLDPQDEMVELVAVAEGLGTSPDLREQWVRLPRPDVALAHPQLARTMADCGFVALARYPGEIGSSLNLEARTRDGQVQVRSLGVSWTPNPMAMIEAILSSVSPEDPRLRELFDRGLGASVEAIWQRRSSAPTGSDLRWFGTPPEAPAISLIVPLYGRYDFMRYQLALFANDPGLRGVELLYVVDDPRIYDPVLKMARDLQPLFGIPFATVHAGRNQGYAAANNLGARQARGETLILLNSDVMPQQAGWAERLAEALASPGVGVAGATLLYEDGSVQHAGMSLEPYAPWGGIRIPVHPGKGQPGGDWPEGPKPVAAVTGACLAIRKTLYDAIGGLDEGFIMGDFEDSDLCARVLARGLAVVWEPSVVLYHLERQSLILNGDGRLRSLLSFFNGWRHERRLQEAGQ